MSIAECNWNYIHIGNYSSEVNLHDYQLSIVFEDTMHGN